MRRTLRRDGGKHTQNILGLSGQAMFGTLGDDEGVGQELVIQVSIAFGTEGKLPIFILTPHLCLRFTWVS